MRFNSLLEKAQSFYDTGDPSHDFAHIGRVVATCRKLAAIEGGNLETLLPAAVLHDIVNLPKNHPERMQASQLAAARAVAVLEECGYTSKEIEEIRKIITEHSFSLGKSPSSIESAILQDADKLDALGAIGIMRTITCGARMGSSYYNLSEPIARIRLQDDKRYTVDHFFVKLFKLPELMNTQAARIEAETRATFMREFLDQLTREISG